MQTLCQLSGLNPGQLIRQFRDTCGMTPHAYLTNLRIQMAQIALQSDTPLVDVALTHGFADQPHFQRTFKRLLAATPVQYRDGPNAYISSKTQLSNSSSANKRFNQRKPRPRVQHCCSQAPAAAQTPSDNQQMGK
ncbi:helix-turn-helix transcriptional regulator [Nitrincola sp. A-D6]|uniref:helix-turn-helix transcriptional regulator n=1 Tax=Nitrincola sp. A-D6 TaxID=1545442 RepID=UPI00136334A6